MTDPVSLQNLLSNTIYAEQINSAQLQGQESARERAVRVQQETQQERSMAVEKAEDTYEVNVDEEGHQAAQEGEEEASPEERRKKREAAEGEDLESDRLIDVLA